MPAVTDCRRAVSSVFSQSFLRQLSAFLAYFQPGHWSLIHTASRFHAAAFTYAAFAIADTYGARYGL